MAPCALAASAVTSACGTITGAVVSRTVTEKLLVAVLPAASVAVQVTVVVPGANAAPDAAAHVTVRTPSTASVDVGNVYVTTAPLAPVASTVMFAGTLLIAGGVVSRTVTEKLLVAVLLCASVAPHATCVVPNGNVDPDAGAHDTGTVPSTSSLAVGLV